MISQKQKKNHFEEILPLPLNFDKMSFKCFFHYHPLQLLNEIDLSGDSIFISNNLKTNIANLTPCRHLMESGMGQCNLNFFSIKVYSTAINGIQ